MSYVRYHGEHAAVPAESGWDRWAGEYATLGASNPVYALGKELLHAVVDQVAPPPRDREAWALDFHCGAGDDLARLLARGWRVAGCDGSAGMLHAAASRCAADLRGGRLQLWHGQAERLTPGGFGDRPFDLIFSTTGGFAYLDDAQFVRVQRALAGMLVPNGVMVLAHLTPFCPAESLYHLAHLRFRRAVERWRGRVAITVRGEPMVMHLRSARHVRRLTVEAGGAVVEAVSPLLWCTPPFQSGFKPGPRMLAALRAIERRSSGITPLAYLADQVVCTIRAPA